MAARATSLTYRKLSGEIANYPQFESKLITKRPAANTAEPNLKLHPCRFPAEPHQQCRDIFFNLYDKIVMLGLSYQLTFPIC